MSSELPFSSQILSSILYLSSNVKPNPLILFILFFILFLEILFGSLKIFVGLLISDNIIHFPFIWGAIWRNDNFLKPMKDLIHKRTIYQKTNRITWQNIKVKIKIIEGIEETYQIFFQCDNNWTLNCND